MSVLQRVSFQPNQRLDTPDLRAIEAFVLNDFRFFLSGFFSPTSYILTGFEISNFSTIFTVPGFTLTQNDVVLFYSQASTQAAGFYVFAGTEQSAAVSLSPSATNYVEVTLTDVAGTPDVRAFWDESANGGQGGEFTDTVDTVINLNLEVLSNISGFTPGNIPLYEVATNSSGIVTSVTDCRNLFFRLGTGGNSPNPNNSFPYPNLPDSTHARFETPITATSATVSNAPFQGGDKNISTFKEWMDAVMSNIKEIKATPYWYSPLFGGTGMASIYQNAALAVLGGGVWTQNPPFLTTTGSVMAASNQLTGLASTTGIVGGNVQIVSGVDIPDSPATTVVSIISNTVTMSANALNTNASESVSFSRAAGGQLALSTPSYIYRLGYTTPRLFLNTFLIDLAIQPDLWVLLPNGDYAVTYGYGQDAATPIVPQQVSATSTNTITVATGGNYVTGAGSILVHGQTFAYTGYTSGTGLFSGVSPDPSGIVQNNDYVYQLDHSGTAYYHYSVQSAIPDIINGVSMGVERVFWLAIYDSAVSTAIILRFGEVSPGETVSSPSSVVTDILSYIGSPGPGFSFPQYTVTATGALTGQTNYNSTAGEDLTTRLSKITTMMADKAQDKTIGLLPVGYTDVVNTTSGGNQLVTFTGGGTLNVAMPGSANNGTIGLSGTLTLAPLQAAYFETFRNALFTISDLTGLTVVNITSVPIDENARIFAYRLSDNNIYLWDGQIIPVGSWPTLNQLTIEEQQDHTMRLISGGFWSYANSTGTLSWSASAFVAIPGLADSANTLLSGSVVLADGQVAYTTINRSGAGGNITLSAIASSAYVQTDYSVIVARRVGPVIYFGLNDSIMTLQDGESKQIGSNGYLNTFTSIAGQSLTAGQAVYISNGTDGGRTTGDAYPVDTSGINPAVRATFIGFVMTAATTGNPVTIIGGGELPGFVGLTPGLVYYADPTTPGGITSTKPVPALGQLVVGVGMAFSSTILDINPALSAATSSSSETYTQFTLANNQSSPANITGFTASPGSIGFSSEYSIIRSYNGPPEVENMDTAFNTNLGTGFSGGGHEVEDIVEQSNGTIVAVGGWSLFNGSSTPNGIVAFNNDGTLNTSFNTNLGTGVNTNPITTISLQSNQQMVFGGHFTTFNGNTRNRFVRLNSDGTEDTAFYTNLGTAFNGTVASTSIQSNQQILVVGLFSQFNGNARAGIVRLNSDGTEDTAFYTNIGTGFSGGLRRAYRCLCSFEPTNISRRRI